MPPKGGKLSQEDVIKFLADIIRSQQIQIDWNKVAEVTGINKDAARKRWATIEKQHGGKIVGGTPAKASATKSKAKATSGGKKRKAAEPEDDEEEEEEEESEVMDVDVKPATKKPAARTGGPGVKAEAKTKKARLSMMQEAESDGKVADFVKEREDLEGSGILFNDEDVV